MPWEECHRISIICFLKISVRTGKFKTISKAVLVDASFLKSKTEKKNQLFQKYPDTYRQDLKHEMLDSIPQA